MFYIIIPIDAGDTPESWYAYLQKTGPIVFYKNEPKVKGDKQVILFRLSKEGVSHFQEPTCFDKKNKTLDFSFITADQIHFQSCNSESDNKLARHSTLDFFHRAWELEHFDYSDQSIAIEGKKGKAEKRKYYILHSGLFQNPPVSISRYAKGREALYYNPSSPTLQDCYEGLQTFELQKNPSDDLSHNLQCLSTFVGGVFEHHSPDRVKCVVDAPSNKKIKLDGENTPPLPAVNLKRFINEGVGICRHHAMLTCYLLDRMKSDQWLPEGKIIQYRMVLDSGIGHSFVLFQSDDPSKIYVIDGTRLAVYPLPEMKLTFIKQYSKRIYTEISAEYLQMPLCSPTIPMEDDMDCHPSNSNH